MVDGFKAMNVFEEAEKRRLAGDWPIELMAEVYTCPFPGCGVLAGRASQTYGWGIVGKQCTACQRIEVWFQDPAPEGRLVYPIASAAPPPDPGLTGEALTDFREAAEVLPHSARAAAALLRLAIERLVKDVAGHSGDLNEGIGVLVREHALPVRVQQALDIVRVIGNEGVHPGTLDLRDDQDTALQLFALVNLIAEYTISMPTRVGAMYSMLPPEKVAGIEQRDRKRPS